MFGGDDFMKVTITGRKVSLRDSFKERIEKKLGKFSRIFDENAEAFVTVTLEKNRQTVEVTIRNGGMVFRAEETAFEMEDALDLVIDSLSRQFRKNKTRIGKKLHQPALAAFVEEMGAKVEEETEFNVVRVKKVPVKPLNVEEAILQMNLLNHEFFMFINDETSAVNVVYRRKDGNYGLLEPDLG